MKKRAILCLFLCLFIGACVKENTIAIGTQIQSKYGAKGCEITFDTFVDNDTANQIKIEIKELGKEFLLRDRFLITSSSALMLFQTLIPEEIKSYHKMKVSISSSTENTSKTYSMRELEIAQYDFSLINHFFDLQNERKLDSTIGLVDTTKIPETSLVAFTNTIFQVDSTYGKIVSVTDIGFAFGQSTETKESITVFFVDVKNGNMTSHYTFNISDNSRKITYVGLNDLKPKLISSTPSDSLR